MDDGNPSALDDSNAPDETHIDDAASVDDPASLITTREPLLTRVRNAPVTSWITFGIVTLAALTVFWRLHPSKIFMDTTPAGGDMGAHVWGPAYLRDNLLSGGSFRGWTMDWYGGFPALHFYMVLPYLLIVLLDVVLPYGVAFKLIAVAGVTTIPISAWFLARMARLPFPAPALFSLAGLLFVFEFNFTIYGGNIASTLAGEFAFSLSLSFALVFLGCFIRGVDEGTHRVWAAVFLAATATSHLIPLAFAVSAAVLYVAVRSYHRLPKLLGGGQTLLVTVAAISMVAAVHRLTDAAVPRLAAWLSIIVLLLIAEVRRTWWALTAGLAGILLSAFWMFPFLARRHYLNDMGWEKLTQVRENLFLPENLNSGTHLETHWLLALAALGALAGVVFWNRMAMSWTAVAFLAAMGFVHWPQDRLWNASFLGFWYLTLYVLAACGVWLVGRAIGNELQRQWASYRQGALATRLAYLAAPVLALTLAYGYTGLHLGQLPGGSNTSDGGYAWGPLRVSPDDRNFVSGWANWNFSGYERKTAYPEYFNLVTTMDELGQERGCGRALWEFGREHLDRYGTPMAPMLLPHWTDGCIASMEGLYFESTASVPHHFLMQSELSQDPSRPMRDIPYSGYDIDRGIDHMRLSGVRYYMAFSETALREASGRPDDLVPVAQSDGWTVYEVQGTSLVEPLAYEPAVVEEIGHGGRDWTDPAVAWFNDDTAREVILVDDGPSEWARVPLVENGETLAAGPAPRHELEPVEVTNVVLDDDRVSFTVDRVGVPVLVKVSYFPNWTVASGADEIHRATPNYMVVVPTENDVVLEYKDSAVEYAGYGMTLAGVAVLYLAARFDPFNRRREGEGDPAFWDRDLDAEAAAYAAGGTLEILDDDGPADGATDTTEAIDPEDTSSDEDAAAVPLTADGPVAESVDDAVFDVFAASEAAPEADDLDGTDDPAEDVASDDVDPDDDVDESGPEEART